MAFIRLKALEDRSLLISFLCKKFQSKMSQTSKLLRFMTIEKNQKKRFGHTYPMEVKCLSMITKSLLNTNNERVEITGQLGSFPAA